MDRSTADLFRDTTPSLLRLAGRHSLCPDDAHDACQRTLEIYLEQRDVVRTATAASWLRSVCKHEAIRLRDARARVVPAAEVAFDAQPAETTDVHERALSRERVARVREALVSCSAEERRALLLRADGSGYAEIMALTGWSYTKVNRLLAAGRARFLARYDAIDSGRACAGYRLVLSTVVDGEASVDDFVALRPHLRHCGGCRAELRDLYALEGVRERTPA